MSEKIVKLRETADDRLAGLPKLGLVRWILVGVDKDSDLNIVASDMTDTEAYGLLGFGQRVVQDSMIG